MGAFADLDPQHVVQRFADAGQRAHNWARGMDVTVLSPRRPQDDDAMEVVLDDPEPSGTQIVSKVRPMVEEFMTRLAETGRVCSQAVFCCELPPVSPSAPGVNPGSSAVMICWRDCCASLMTFRVALTSAALTSFVNQG